MPRQSPFPSVNIPPIDIWELLFSTTDTRYPDEKEIFIDGLTSRAYSLSSVRDTATRVGRYFKDQWHWSKGDVLAFYSSNCIDIPPVLWACHFAGGIVTTTNPSYTVDELTRQLQDSGAKAIVTQAAYVPSALKAAAAAGIPSNRILLIGDSFCDGYLHLQDVLMYSSAETTTRTALAPEDLAFLVYSSGTTGPPKGVMLSHGNIVSNILMLQHESGELGKRSGSSMITFLPFFHIYGLVRLVHDPMYYGIPSIILERFDIELFCDLVQKHNVTFAHVVPPVMLLLAKHPTIERYNLSSLQMMSSGAAPLSWSLTKQVHERIGIPCKQAYGLSETSPTTHSQEWSDWDMFRGSVGKLLPNQTSMFVDPDGNEVVSGSIGELCIHGPNVFGGYWKNADATKSAFTDNGFFKTGDIGYEDSHGNTFITDRAKELIKYKGFQIAPAEIEGHLTAHPKITGAAVVGLWREEEATELPLAYVSLLPEYQPRSETEKEHLAQEISNWLAKVVAPHKRLRAGVWFIDAIPRNPSGKILRRVLRDQAARAEENRKLKASKPKL